MSIKKGKEIKRGHDLKDNSWKNMKLFLTISEMVARSLKQKDYKLKSANCSIVFLLHLNFIGL